MATMLPTGEVLLLLYWGWKGGCPAMLPEPGCLSSTSPGGSGQRSMDKGGASDVGAQLRERIVSKGLEGVIVADSELSYIDGETGVLCYRGYDVNDLAQHATYEEVVYLLWFGDLPSRTQLEDFAARLRAERAIPPCIYQLMSVMPDGTAPIDMLRVAVAALAAADPETTLNTPEANLRKSIRLVAKLPTIVAAYQRYLRGQEPIAPHTELGHAANLLYMLTGKRPSALHERAFDVAMLLMVDHGLNASTFAARVTAATLSDLYSAAISAMSAIKGPLHGAANQKAMEMLIEIGEEERAEDYVREALAAHKRIMGFGHRVYRTMDPRGRPLMALAEELSLDGADPRWYRIARKVRDAVWEQKSLNPNVDFYAGVTFHMLGIAPDFYPTILACSRAPGWAAQVMEQYADNRLIRPRARYVGPKDRIYVPIDQR